MKIIVSTLVAAPIQEVWRAYTTPDDIKRWNTASADWHTTAATVDLRPGGRFSSRMEAKDGSFGFDFEGVYTKVVPHQLIEYSFGDRAAVVEFTEGAGGVTVTVAFDGETSHSEEQQRTGWQAILDNFARHVKGKLPSPMPPVAIVAAEAPSRAKRSLYPEPFASRMEGRLKHPLGDLFGLGNFGVNLTRLRPGAVSSLRHAHSKQDEFIYVLEGCPVLHTDEGRTPLRPGMCAGFKAGTGNGHRLMNETSADVVYLEVGDRTPGDEGTYPDDDLQAQLVDGAWVFTHKDGSPY